MRKLSFTLFFMALYGLSLFGNSIFNTVTLTVTELENVDCFGENSGYLEIEASNGTPPFSYSLNGTMSSTGIFEELTAGDYTAIVTDGTGCSDMLTISITQPDTLILTIAELNDVQCAGATNGSVQLATMGGSGGFSYTLGGVVNTTGFFENLSPDTYEVSVADNNGCEATIDVVIGVGSGISAFIAVQANVDCFGNNTGEVQIAGSDGVAPYQYRLGAQVNDTGIFSNLNAGAYTFLIFDGVGCSTTQEVIITEPNALTADIAATTNLSCFEANDGSFQINANGGTPGYTFNTLNDSNADGNFINQAAGTYEILVTDANNCSVTEMVTITQPSPITIADPVVTNIDCFGNSNGSIEITASGGTGGFTYSIDNQTNTTGIFSDLSAGSYTVFATDASNCTMTAMVLVTEPNDLVGAVDAIFNINCGSVGTGAVDLSAVGGTGEIIFSLNGATNTDGFFEGLPAGDYFAMVSDANNCQTTIAFTILESAGLGINIIELSNTTCDGDSDGMITLEANGGTGVYTYSLNGATNTTGLFTGLAAGVYMATASDDMGCSTMVEFTIDSPTAIDLDVVVTPIACNGDLTTLQATAEGGVGNFSYSIGLQNNTTGTFDNLPAGTYPVMATDMNGCTITSEVIIEEPVELQILVPGFSATSCFGGNDGFIQLLGMGGTGSYTYTLDDESNTTGLFEDLLAGFYELAVMDENGCMATTPFTVSEPNEIFGEIINIQNAGCNMMPGSAQVLGMGGTGAFTYTLNMETNDTGIFDNLPAGIYDLLLTDANGCTNTLAFLIEESIDVSADLVTQTNVDCAGEATGSFVISAMGGTGISFTLENETNTTGAFENLSAGIYEVLVANANGCTTTVPVVIEEPEAIMIDMVSLESPLCANTADGSIQVIAIGGSGMLSYSLDGMTNTTGFFEELTGGDYELAVEDENGCTVIFNFVIETPNPLVLSVLDVSPDTGSEDGSFDVQGSGGTSPYQFSLDGVNFQNNSPFINLMFGDYTAYIMDANGCISTTTVNVPFFDNTYGLESGVAAMSVFPNPFEGALVIDMELFIGQSLNFTLLTIDGRELRTIQQDFAAGQSKITLESLQDLSAGTYLLQVVGSEFYGHFKVIKR